MPFRGSILSQVGARLIRPRGDTLLPSQSYSTAVKETFERALEAVRRRGGKPYAIPTGASDRPLGGLGYAHFADELARQEEDLGLFFDTVVTATCTGSTQADMVGFLAQVHAQRVIGVDTAADAVMTRVAVTKIARATALHQQVVLAFPDEDAIPNGVLHSCERPGERVPRRVYVAPIRPMLPGRAI